MFHVAQCVYRKLASAPQAAFSFIGMTLIFKLSLNLISECFSIRPLVSEPDPEPAPELVLSQKTITYSLKFEMDSVLRDSCCSGVRCSDQLNPATAPHIIKLASDRICEPEVKVRL